ncbi:unnamed protein product [marine sediment metagenome]|uniref:H-type lectin domain-containing protein n=1 Tax=marine sediment metagenome TaxID=412755 RepID=X1RJL8_9ZZZZ
MPEFSTPITSKVQEMIEAGGGGGGANIKSGVSSSPEGDEKQVDFVTPFPSNPRVIISAYMFSREVWTIQVTTNFFKWTSGYGTGSAVVHWIATTAGNL